jgi:3',5'-nucleoside bisphosphate phosphatase
MFRDFIAGKKYVDLHIHTKCPDGTHTLEEIIDKASEKKLRTISITDHDCLDAYPVVSTRGAEREVEVISGVELSSELDGRDIHILGYCIDINHQPLKDKLVELKQARYLRARKIVENLNKQGMDLRFETVLNIAGTAAIGRPHIAAALLKEELVYSFREAFDKFIGYESPAYVKKLSISPKDVFSLIRAAGGVPVLAHPGVSNVDERIPQFIEDGLMGIECYHSEHTPQQERFYLNYCKKHDLCYTGGSDFHTTTLNKPEIGHHKIPYTTVESIKLKAAVVAQQTAS